MTRKIRLGFTNDLNDKIDIAKMLLKKMPEVEYQVFPEFLAEVTPAQIEGFDILVSFYGTRWTRRTLEGNKRLLAIHLTGVGYDLVDVPALTNAGVMLYITPRASRRGMAVANLTMLLTLSTRILEKHQIIREGRWREASKCYGYGLIGKTLGSIGAGNIGHEMFRLAKPLGMKHIVFDPYISPEAVADVDVKLVDMDTVLAESDFLNIGCRLNEKTRHLIGLNELRKMKKTAFLINTARGPIVDEAALIKALRDGWIRGAGLDVFEQEPTPNDNPLLKMDNVITTPHSLGWTDEHWTDTWDEIIEQISHITRGNIPEGLANREVLDKPEFKTKMQDFRAGL